MSLQALQGVPRKAAGVTRVVICEEVFDYKVGGDQIAVLHPLSKLTFAVQAPPGRPNGSLMALDAYAKANIKYLTAIKKAIWNQFTELSQKARK